MRILAGFALALVFSGANANEALYYACETCHERDGSGNEAIGAPAIAGMDAEYLADQMRKFRDGIRGASIDDLPGRQMNLIASLLTDDKEIEGIARYVARMDRQAVRLTLDVDSNEGFDLYRNCAACHGDDGAGNKTLNAPAIAGLDDWYIKSQLTRFRDGSRGSHPEDTSGAQMRMAVANLTDVAIEILSVYTATLEQKIEESQ